MDKLRTCRHISHDQVPSGVYEETNGHINKGKMFISSTSPPAVPAAYLRQFQRDFSLFLKSRAAEVVPGGRMVLSMLGREDDCCTDSKTIKLWDLLSDSLAMLVEQGVVEQGKVDALDMPFYPPCIQEIEEEVRKEGSFRLDYGRAYELKLPKGAARTLSMAIRAVHESMLNHHFGPEIMDPLFNTYTDLIGEAVDREGVTTVQVGVVLVKL